MINGFSNCFAIQIVMDTWGLTGQHVLDFTLYSGALGTAFLLLKSYQVHKNKNDLYLCLEIVKACDSSSLASRCSLFLSHKFQCGNPSQLHCNQYLD